MDIFYASFTSFALLAARSFDRDVLLNDVSELFLVDFGSGHELVLE